MIRFRPFATWVERGEDRPAVEARGSLEEGRGSLEEGRFILQIAGQTIALHTTQIGRDDDGDWCEVSEQETVSSAGWSVCVEIEPDAYAPGAMIMLRYPAGNQAVESSISLYFYADGSFEASGGSMVADQRHLTRAPN